MEKGIEIVNLSKTIFSKPIVSSISFDVNKGEVFGFLGPNGAGKTTLIRMLVSLIRPTQGTIRICGLDLRKERSKAMKKVGAVIEQPELYNYMSGYQNLKHYANMHSGVTDAEINEISKILKIDGSLSKRVKAYSLGMKQRLGLAQALLHGPEVLILDEPTNGLDPEGIREFREYIRYLSEELNISILISSHLLSEIEMMCHRIGIIENGRLIKIEDLRENENIKAQKYHLKVDNAALALQLIKNTNFTCHRVNLNQLEILINEENIPQILHLLSSNNVNVFSVTPVSDSLEDIYFNTVSEIGGK